MKKKITLSSPAKINLTLDILPKKSGANFHELKTIYHTIGLSDKIEITELVKFEIVGGFDFPMEQNLIFKAWQLIQKNFPNKKLPNVKVTVEKNIPLGGGLGGGSSNFATFAKGYFQLFDLGEIPEELIWASGSIGKDIPFFFHDRRCAIGTGFGEVISEVPFDADLFQNIPIYIYQPKFQNPTPEMFQKCTDLGTGFTEKFIKNPDLINCGNGFDCFLSEKKYQEIISSDKMEAVFMSGSGSCFLSFKKLEIPDCNIVETIL